MTPGLWTLLQGARRKSTLHLIISGRSKMFFSSPVFFVTCFFPHMFYSSHLLNLILCPSYQVNPLNMDRTDNGARHLRAMLPNRSWNGRPNMCHWQICQINLNCSAFFPTLALAKQPRLWSNRDQDFRQRTSQQQFMTSYAPEKYTRNQPLFRLKLIFKFPAELCSSRHPGHVQQAGDGVQRVHRLLWRLPKVQRGER